MNARPITICDTCFAVNCREHNGGDREYECGICLTSFPTIIVAQKCCANDISWRPLEASCFAPTKKSEPFRIEH